MYAGQDQNTQEENGDTRECEAMRKMFVGGLNRETTEEDFFNHFGQFGEIVDKVIITDPQTRQSRGFGFITFQQSDSVENVLNSRPHVVDGKTLDVKRAMPREFNTPGAHSKTKKLFVGGFKGIELTSEELQAYIESRHPTDFGTIEKIDFLKDRETNILKGFGFIECSSFDFADRLAISEASFELNGRTLHIKKAEPKPEPGMYGQAGGRGGGRGMSRGGRGRGGSGYGNNSYGGNYGSGNGGYSTSYPSYNMNDGYNQNQAQNNYGQNNYGQGYGQNQGYGQQQINAGSYGNASYGQQGYNAMGTYGQTNNYGSQGYNQGSFDNQNLSGARGGGRGGNTRYQPY